MSDNQKTDNGDVNTWKNPNVKADKYIKIKQKIEIVIGGKLYEMSISEAEDLYSQLATILNKGKEFVPYYPPAPKQPLVPNDTPIDPWPIDPWRPFSPYRPQWKPLWNDVWCDAAISYVNQLSTDDLFPEAKSPKGHTVWRATI